MAHMINKHVIIKSLIDVFSKNIKENEQNRLNDGVQKLRKLELPVSNVDELQTIITAGWLRSYIDDAKKTYLGNGCFVPSEIKNRDLKAFESVYESAEAAISEIAGVIDRVQLPLKIDGKGKFWFDEVQLMDKAKQMATCTIPDVCREYYKVVGVVADAYKQLKEFEKSHNFKGLSGGVFMFGTLGKKTFQELVQDGMITQECYAEMVAHGVVGEIT